MADVLASAVALRAVAYCRDAIGTPYVYGGDTASGYDCSGLIYAAYRSTGRAFNWRTSEQQWGAGLQRVQWGSWAPGDLIFSQWPGDNASPGHVVLYAGRGWCIAAPAPGRKVQWERVSTFAPPHYVGSARPYPLPAGTSAPAQGPKINPTPGVAGYDPSIPAGDTNVTDPNSTPPSGDTNPSDSSGGAAIAAGLGGGVLLIGAVVILGGLAAYLWWRSRQGGASLPTDAPGGGAA